LLAVDAAEDLLSKSVDLDSIVIDFVAAGIVAILLVVLARFRGLLWELIKIEVFDLPAKHQIDMISHFIKDSLLGKLYAIRNIAGQQLEQIWLVVILCLVSPIRDNLLFLSDLRLCL
jgi:hypothetical protein